MATRGWIVATAALMLTAPALAEDDGALLRSMRQFGNVTAGQPTGGAGPADKILSFGRRGAETVVTGMAVTPPDRWPALGQGTAAVMRTRASAGDGDRMPTTADFDLVRSTGIRLFVVGEWSRPPVIWEIARHGEEVRFRTIGTDGRPGPWAAPVSVPAASAP